MIFPGQKVSNTLLEENRGQVYITLVHVTWLDYSQMDTQMLVYQETKRELSTTDTQNARLVNQKKYEVVSE